MLAAQNKEFDKFLFSFVPGTTLPRNPDIQGLRENEKRTLNALVALSASQQKEVIQYVVRIVYELILNNRDKYCRIPGKHRGKIFLKRREIHKRARNEVKYILHLLGWL